ncbi:MAG TPA: hypothetical protein VGM39_02425 [Kofleriaceae bacterium]|jgi:hypothetical protein
MRSLLLASLIIPLGLTACAGNSVDLGTGVGDDGDPGSGGSGGGGGSDDGGGPNVDTTCQNHGETNIFPAGLRAYDIALSGTTLIAVSSPLGANAANTKLVTCPVTGCDQPTTLATPNRLATEVEVEADGANVYWTERSSTDPSGSDRLVRAVTTGANRSVLLEYNVTTSFNPIRPVVAADNRVSFYAYGRGANGLGELRTAASAASSTSVLTTMTTNVPVLATAEGYTALWTDGPGATVDRRIRGLDPTGAEVAASPALVGVLSVATDGAAVMYSTLQSNIETTYACLATDCTAPLDLNATYGAAGNRFTFANGRAYFVATISSCESQFPKYAFESCEVPDLLDGSCTPDVHAVGDFELINMRSLMVGATTAVFSSKLDGSVVRIDL